VHRLASYPEIYTIQQNQVQYVSLIENKRNVLFYFVNGRYIQQMRFATAIDVLLHNCVYVGISSDVDELRAQRALWHGVERRAIN
jgi:hypothetical protein